MIPEIDVKAQAAAPLQLREVTIRRFRSLFHVGPLPIQPDLTVLTGENDGGKSTFLDAIGFLLGEYSVVEGDHSMWDLDGAVEVEGTFYAVNDFEFSCPVRVRAQKSPGSGRQRHVAELCHVAFGANPVDLPLPDLKAKLHDLGIPPPGGNRKEPYIDAANAWIASRDTSEFDYVWVPLTPELDRRLPRFTRFSSAVADQPAQIVRTLVDRETRRLLVDEALHADQLDEIGRTLDREINKSLEDVKSTIQKYCPDLDGIEIGASFDFRRPSSQVELRVSRDGNVVDLERAGEGRRRRVTLAIHEASLHTMEVKEATATEFLAYDEPDTHLDYTAQRSLFDILDRQARLDHIQVVAATHSLNFIDKVSLRSVLHFKLDDDLRTAVAMLGSEVHADELEFIDSVCVGMGLRNSSLLNERCFLVVEGETEATAIPSLFKTLTGYSMAAAGITLLNTQGSGAIRRLVEVLVCELKRNVVVLVDADARSASASGINTAWLSAMGLREGVEAYFIGENEFEDAFSDELWLRTLLLHFGVQDGGPNWTLKDLAGIRCGDQKFGDALRNLVCKRRRDNAIAKPDLGFALAQTCGGESDIPEPLAICLRRVLCIAQGELSGGSSSYP